PTDYATLSLHDALPILLTSKSSMAVGRSGVSSMQGLVAQSSGLHAKQILAQTGGLRHELLSCDAIRDHILCVLILTRFMEKLMRSEEHTSELQSLRHLV